MCLHAAADVRRLRKYEAPDRLLEVLDVACMIVHTIHRQKPREFFRRLYIDA